MEQENSLDMELQLREWFDDNYEELRLVGGHALNTHVKEVAFQHVLQYWRKMWHIANEVTETELTLMLPRQKHPQDESFPFEVTLIYCVQKMSSICTMLKLRALMILKEI